MIWKLFRCRVCDEKTERISDLKQQIEFLKNQLAPSYQIPRINLEANNILNGAGGEDAEPTPEELAQLQKEKEERDALLSGNYN